MAVTNSGGNQAGPHGAAAGGRPGIPRSTALQHAGEQGLLFDDTELAGHTDDVG